VSSEIFLRKLRTAPLAVPFPPCGTRRPENVNDPDCYTARLAQACHAASSTCFVPMAVGLGTVGLINRCSFFAISLVAGSNRARPGAKRCFQPRSTKVMTRLQARKINTLVLRPYDSGPFAKRSRLSGTTVEAPAFRPGNKQLENLRPLGPDNFRRSRH
jgi:hypothetical protein